MKLRIDALQELRLGLGVALLQALEQPRRARARIVHRGIPHRVAV